MPHRDSLDKVIQTYFACVTAEAFNYKGVVYHPRELRVSPSIFRGFTCPPMCGGCCPRFSLDYLPEEEKPDMPLTMREVAFNGSTVYIYSDLQEVPAIFCKNLQKDGRCGIHGRQPFSCDFELIRFLEFKEEGHANHLTQKLFGRGWAMRRVDDQRGALCEMTPITDETVAEVVRKLGRLNQWAEHFGISTKVPTILEWALNGDRDQPFYV
jgi:hypothetical protein